MTQRLRICVEGRVQGVGFRPAVFRHARDCGLAGWVTNTSEGVLIEVEGAHEKAETFLALLQSAPPPMAKIVKIIHEWIEPKGENVFQIVPSIGVEKPKTQVSPDIALCADCRRELLDPNNRRFYYPFINCTNCGPRFTIVRGIPYDREKTTMRIFVMCADCRREYEEPLNRRFHAQPNACPVCGPRISITTEPSNFSHQPSAENRKTDIQEIAKMLKAGKIVAIKGLGGFHLACDAASDSAVQTLRQRKGRYDKPFALMARDAETVKQYCEVSPEEERLLQSAASPIVILKRRISDSPFFPVSDFVAPHNQYLGFMLPYTPLHALIMQEAPPVLVMTSGNVSKEPIAYENEEAGARLGAIADFFVTHNRGIETSCDDSVTRIFPKTGEEMILRRSRGYAPSPLKLPFAAKAPILACGAHFSNTFALASGDEIQISHHIGDLENLEALTAFEKGIAHFRNIFEINPEIAFCDLHPDYLSTKYARDTAAAEPTFRVIGVQHHHAHIASCMADNQIPPETKVIGVAFDGTGLGADGAMWGGEFLIADYRDFKRAAHLKYLPLPGGEAAIREPWRMAAVYLRDAFGENFAKIDIDFNRRMNRAKWATLQNMIAGEVNSPPTSSMGRLFDAVASLCGARDSINYEGQAAIELEMAGGDGQWVMDNGQSRYLYEIVTDAGLRVIDCRAIIRGVVEDLQKGMDIKSISIKFHETVSAIIADICKELRETSAINNVALSGGVFQNMMLLRRAFELLTEAGFKVHVHSHVPPNDGGISLGQAIIAAAQLQEV
ncbi:MAG TPA: carbamoyltransferase HypF [Candidatus Sumerlaeia bacterium]|nr:carbamoyltransferase HypF [Candidatus Sumerlaeia bacterium]